MQGAQRKGAGEVRIQEGFQMLPHSMMADGARDVGFVLEDTAAGLLEAMLGEGAPSLM